MTHPVSFRSHVLKTIDQEKITTKQAAARFNIGTDSIVRWKRTIEPKQTRNRKALKIDMQKLEQRVKAQPDIYQYELANEFNVAKSTIYYALKRLKYTLKKRHSPIPKLTQKNAKNLQKKSSVIRNRKDP